MNIFRCIVVLLWGFLFKTKDNPPSLHPSLKLRMSKKAMVDEESIKTKVSQKSAIRNQESGISERIKQMEDRNTAILYLV